MSSQSATPPAQTSPEHVVMAKNSPALDWKIYQGEQLKYQILWDQELQNRSEYVEYEQTVVMMLSWKESDLVKEDLDEEIADLAKVFAEDYGFAVEQEVLDSSGKPQIDIVAILGNFVRKYDKKGTLLILYYAGHGWSGSKDKKDQHVLAGFNLNDKATVTHRAPIDWFEAEKVFANAQDADLLGIFDCCEAGHLLGRGRRAFEYLAACRDGERTRGAGPKSFTRALIWALRQQRKDGINWFSVKELCEKVVRAPGFPEGEVHPQAGPQSAELLSSEPIIIAPADRLLDPDACKRREDSRAAGSKTSSREYLDLRFRFDKKLNKKEFKKVALKIKTLMDDRNFNAKEVTFIEKHCRSRGWDLLRRHVAGGSFSLSATTPVDIGDEDAVSTPHASPALVEERPATPDTSRLRRTISKRSQVAVDGPKSKRLKGDTE